MIKLKRPLVLNGTFYKELINLIQVTSYKLRGCPDLEEALTIPVSF